MGFRIQGFKVTTFVASVFAGFAASVVGAQPRSFVTAGDAEIRKILGERIEVQGNDIGIIVGIIEPQGRRIISSGHRSANAVQTDIAKAIAGQLHAKLSPAEKSPIEQPPTTHLIAYDRYLRAKKQGSVPRDRIHAGLPSDSDACALAIQTRANAPHYM